MKKIALFPGSFDPFHKGHRYIVNVGLQLFDEVIVCVAVNPLKDKGYFTIGARTNIIETVFKDEPRVKVVNTVSTVVEEAQRCGASFIIKGARNGEDFTSEVAQSDANWAMGKIPTIVIPTPHELSFISSTMIRSVLQSRGNKNNSELVRDFMC